MKAWKFSSESELFGQNTMGVRLMRKCILLLISLLLARTAYADQVSEGGLQYRRTGLTILSVEVGVEGDLNLCHIYAIDPNNSVYSTHAYFDGTTLQGKNLLATALSIKATGATAMIRFLINQATVLLNSAPPGYSTNHKLIGIQAE